MRNLVMCLLLVCLIVFVCGCASEPKSRGWREGEAQEELDFDDVDANGNGFIEEEEFEDSFPDADLQVFSSADDNGDDKLTEDEWGWIE